MSTGERSRLEPKNDPTTELTLMGVLVITHDRIWSSCVNRYSLEPRL